MHEMMVAQSLIQIISDEAAKHDAKPVGAKISCGMLNPVNDEALRFAFEAIGKDTPCEGLKSSRSSGSSGPGACYLPGERPLPLGVR